MSSIRQANHHHVKPSGDSAGQPLNRVFERYRLTLDTAVVKAIEKAVNEARRKDLDDFGVTYRVLGA